MDAYVISNDVVEVQGADAEFFNVGNEKYFVIDDYTRKITPPSGFLNLGVESDAKSERVWFKCPRYVGDNLDLSKLNLYINYQNAKGEKDRHYVEDVTIDGDYILFSWRLERKVLKYKGTVKFIVCALQIASEGVKEHEWNTTLCSGTVLEGLEVENPEPDIPEYDIVNQLLSLWKELKPADYNQNDPTQPDYIKNRPFYEHTDVWCYFDRQHVVDGVGIVSDGWVVPNRKWTIGEKIVVTVIVDGVASCETLTIHADNLMASNDNQPVFPEFTLGGCSITIGGAPYLYGNKKEMQTGGFSADGMFSTCDVGKASKCGSMLVDQLTEEEASELVGKTVYIMNPNKTEGQISSFPATICGISLEWQYIFYDEAGIPDPLPFSVSAGFTIVSGGAGLDENEEPAACLTVACLYPNCTPESIVHAKLELVKIVPMDEKFIPNFILRKKHLDAIFGHCMVTEILSGLTSGMNISLEYPLNFSTWSVWLADTKISGDLKPNETFVSASELFGSEDITVRINTEKFVVVAIAVFVNRHKKASWGTLQFVGIENI